MPDSYLSFMRTPCAEPDRGQYDTRHHHHKRKRPDHGRPLHIFHLSSRASEVAHEGMTQRHTLQSLSVGDDVACYVRKQDADQSLWTEIVPGLRVSEGVHECIRL